MLVRTKAESVNLTSSMLRKQPHISSMSNDKNSYTSVSAWEWGNGRELWETADTLGGGEA